MKIKAIKNVLMIMILQLSLFIFVACEKEPNLENGANGEYEYEGITFSYVVEEEGITVTKVKPDNGERLVFPEKIGEKKVIDVAGDCTMNYKEVKFAGIKTEPEVDNETIKKIEFYDNVEINNDIFWSMKSLVEVQLPEGVAEFGKCFFRIQTLEKVILPNTVTAVSDGAFNGCQNLTEINLSNIKSIGNNAFSGCKKLVEVDLCNVEYIGENAFKDCVNLSCDLSFDVLLIENIEYGAFENCTKLEGKKVIFNKLQSSAHYNRKFPFKSTGVEIEAEGLDEITIRCLKSKK